MAAAILYSRMNFGEETDFVLSQELLIEKRTDQKLFGVGVRVHPGSLSR